ncbi:MAG: hypothetical protein ABH919_03070 [bacterium]
MDYFVRKFSRLPYAVAVLCSCASWGLLCAVLGYFLILGQADFEATGTKTIFVFTFPLYVTIGLIRIFIEYGALRIIGIKERRRELRVLNDNIKEGHILPDLSNKTLQEIFYSLADRPMDAIRVGFKVSWFIVFLSFITEYLASNGMTTNILVIFISGVIVEILLVIFLIFFAQQFISPALKECRELLSKRGERVKEPQFIFSNFRTKLDLSFAIPIFTVLIIFFSFKIDLKIIIFIAISLIMAILISRALSSSVSQVFSEINDFTEDLSRAKKVLFCTGSLSPEIIDLSVGLNRAAEEVYISRKKTEQSRTELKKRVDELEKWKKLITGRELKVAELEKERRELKIKLKSKK